MHVPNCHTPYEKLGIVYDAEVVDSLIEPPYHCAEPGSQEKCPIEKRAENLVLRKCRE